MWPSALVWFTPTRYALRHRDICHICSLGITIVYYILCPYCFTYIWEISFIASFRMKSMLTWIHVEIAHFLLICSHLSLACHAYIHMIMNISCSACLLPWAVYNLQVCRWAVEWTYDVYTFPHSTKKSVTTMLTYPWKCTVLHCNHLGNTWKPLELMIRHFDYCPNASKGDNQSVRSSAPVVSRCFPGGYNVKLYISRGRLSWWLLAFLLSANYPYVVQNLVSGACDKRGKEYHCCRMFGDVWWLAVHIIVNINKALSPDLGTHVMHEMLLFLSCLHFSTFIHTIYTRI